MNEQVAGDAADSQPLGERLFRAIETRIISGEIGLGEPLNEKSLAAEFNVSRGPVREAMRRLQGVGLIRREPYLRAQVVELTREQIAELFQMREALEGMAARLASRRITRERCDEILHALEADHQALGRGAVQSPFDFHRAIVEASGNNKIISTLNGELSQLFRLYRRHSGNAPHRREAAFREHWQILRAVSDGDGELAESLIRSHISRAAENLLRE